MDKLLYIIGVLAAAVMWLFVKKQSAEALLENTKLKEKLLDKDREKVNNDALLKVEEEKRLKLVKSDKDKPVDPGDFN